MIRLSTILRACLSLVGVMILSLMIVSPAAATTLPANFGETPFIGGLTRPTAMQFAPDGRLFITQQDGDLRVVKNGALLPNAFVSLSVNASGERGLLGIAFDPNFTTNQFLYLYYTTNTSPARNRVSRFTANGDVAAAGSELVLMTMDPLSSATNHNGGALHFGSDGLLYVATGENANPPLAQSLTSPYGKILRINPAAYSASNVNAIFPSTNPFWQAPPSTSTFHWRNAIWALGLRNPFTFDVQRGTGRIYINDVGSSGTNRREEINEGAIGANYGWPNTEGNGGGGFTGPVYAYGGSGTISGCAITGGAFYNPVIPNFPLEYVGDYFFADYCSDWIARFDPATGTASLFATLISSSTVDLKIGPDGSLYYLSRGAGAVNRIRYTPPAGDTLAIYNTNLGWTSLINTLANPPAPANFNTYASNGPISEDWVMGDWNGDTQETPGVYLNGAFWFTNTIGSGATWNYVWIGPTNVRVVAGRFDPARNNQCIGAAVEGFSIGFPLLFACDFSTQTPAIGVHWLGLPLELSEVASSAYQFVAGDFDANGVDTIGARRGVYAVWSNAALTNSLAVWQNGQYLGQPLISTADQAVAGDWDNDGRDTFGLYYGPAAHGASYNVFLYRNDQVWNPTTYPYLQQNVGTPVGSPTVADSWRDRNIAGASLPELIPGEVPPGYDVQVIEPEKPTPIPEGSLDAPPPGP